VLDVGCGTGGFARAIASAAPAEVTGFDRSARFIDFARRRPRPPAGAVRWVVGDAEQLPFAALSFDRVLLSLVLHQLADPRAGVAGAVRVLRGGGLVLVRTIAPEDVAGRVPQRFIPRMAAADAARLPSVEAITAWLAQAGFASVTAHLHHRRDEAAVSGVIASWGAEKPDHAPGSRAQSTPCAARWRGDRPAAAGVGQVWIRGHAGGISVGRDG
jgi:SAM-dependent methyltransferase